MLNSLKHYTFRQRNIEMTKIHYYLQKIQVLTHSYFRENWGFPFIAGFLIFLFSSAILLAADMSYWAEPIANISYFSLVVGVVLQLIGFSQTIKKNGDISNGSS
jgi:hypothetical protein